MTSRMGVLPVAVGWVCDELDGCVTSRMDV